MIPIDDNHYAGGPGEVITVSVRVDKLPYLCGFQDPPDGSTWTNITRDPQGEQRSFSMPTAGSRVVAVRYVATYTESIADGDPDPTQTYTIVISGSTGGTRTSFIVVGTNSLPIQIAYFFFKAT